MFSFMQNIKETGLHLVRKIFNREFLSLMALYILVIINLFYVHHSVFFSVNDFPGIRPYYSPFVFATFDFLICYVLVSIVCLRHRVLTYVLTYLLFLALILGNIIYSRYFGQYMPLSILGEYDNFQSTWWVGYLLEAFKVSDCIVLINVLLAVALILYARRLKSRISFTPPILSLLILIVFHLTIGVNYLSNVAPRKYSSIDEWYDINIGTSFLRRCMYDSDWMVCNNGFLRCQFIPYFVNPSSTIELSSSELSEIKEFLSKNKIQEGELTDSAIVIKESPNIVFLLVESYLSLATKVQVDGYEITPNINRLLSEQRCYSNFAMTTNRGAGESSDAQISYLTGLVPLKSEPSINYILRDSVTALPALLRDKKGYTTYITIPTNSGFWHQSEANVKYGLDHMRALGMYQTDSLVFEDVINNDNALEEPYFHLILTISMHGTYEDDTHKDFSLPFTFPASFSKEYCNYLKRCYYTDYHIGKYIDYLKSKGDYDNTVIIITSDHEVKTGSLNMTLSDEELNDLPFILLHTNAGATNTYNGRIEQVDLFPSLIDLFGLKSQWRGVGQAYSEKDIPVKSTTSKEQYPKR